MRSPSPALRMAEPGQAAVTSSGGNVLFQSPAMPATFAAPLPAGGVSRPYRARGRAPQHRKPGQRRHSGPIPAGMVRSSCVGPPRREGRRRPTGGPRHVYGLPASASLGCQSYTTPLRIKLAASSSSTTWTPVRKRTSEMRLRSACPANRPISVGTTAKVDSNHAEPFMAPSL